MHTTTIPFLSVLLFLLTLSLGATAADKLVGIRDAETENTIRAMTMPLFQAAGMAPNAFRLFLLNDREMNAFVTNGLDLVINSGLILKTENTNQFAGILAHEVGHIVGGHLIGRLEELEAEWLKSLLVTAAGAAISIAGGRGDIGVGVILAGQEIGYRNLLRFTRAQEATADQAAVRLLEATRQSAQGLVDFFGIMDNNQAMRLAPQHDPYLRTHPPNRERITFLRHHVETSAYATVPPNPVIEQRYQRVRAKLFAFLESPARTLARYKTVDESLPARYARAIALYKKADLSQALPFIEALVAEQPEDPYFLEMKGQMLFENGRLAEAATTYRQAVSLLPENALLHTALGQILIEIEEGTKFLDEAMAHLAMAAKQEPDNAFPWRLLSIVYGRQGNTAMTAYAMAEYAFLTGRYGEARHHATRAIQLLPKDSPKALRAQDIKVQIERRVDRQRRTVP
ncbi:MAG: putative Zn-dependent protease [Rhodospirillaceae bacterium]|nr:MAG: putative Zn-dependent protease [Rhodospirillaceae bacterium]